MSNPLPYNFNQQAPLSILQKKPTFAPDLRRSLSIMQTFDLISRIPIGGLTKSERLSSVRLSTN